MTPQEKPEWFELSEGEGSANVRRVSKTLPITAIIATMAILGIGGVVAQTQDPSLASATEVTSQPQTQTQTQTQTQSATTADSVAVSAAASAPAIAMPPTGRGDDDEDDDEGDDDEHHKSRNSHGDDDDDDDDRFGDDD